MSNSPVGISGFAVHVPRLRVDLRDWCDWTDGDWEKIREVVGTGFRLPGPKQGVYTMAATAVLKLIARYDVDPAQVHFLALGTESSTDNSAGAVIAKGMIDDELKRQGKQPLSRNCEVPEFKHACLGGIYAIKNAVRFLSTDGAKSKAIVVCSDIALYGLGTSGEPTQGAGAVAILLEADPTIATIDLHKSGSASDYRGVDFRKPIEYKNGSGKTLATSNLPVFNGRYSASCYIDEMQHALKEMYQRSNKNAIEYAHSIAAVFMHRPFRRMPENAWGMAWLFSLATDASSGHEQLQCLCTAAEVELDDLLQEIQHPADLTKFAVHDRIRDEVFPLTSKVLRKARNTDEWQKQVSSKMLLGTSWMEELGNLYTGALPAWFAAGLEEAAEKSVPLADKEILLLGYGSGDAAEAIPVRIVPGWEQAAARVDMAETMAESVNLTQEQYIALREGRDDIQPESSRKDEFIIERIGSNKDETFQDQGIEYYRFNG